MNTQNKNRLRMKAVWGVILLVAGILSKTTGEGLVNFSVNGTRMPVSDLLSAIAATMMITVGTIMLLSNLLTAKE